MHLQIYRKLTFKKPYIYKFIETADSDFLLFYHEDEGGSIDNVSKVADDVVDVFKDSPRTRTAIVAITLHTLRER